MSALLEIARSFRPRILAEREFRDVHAITQHIAVHPRVLETAGRVLFGLDPEVPLLV